MSKFDKIGLVVIVILLFVGILTNPKESDHRTKIINEYKNITGISLLDNTFGKLSSKMTVELWDLEVRNYLIFSIGIIDDDSNSDTKKTGISIGYLGNVYTYHDFIDKTQ